MSGLKCLCGKNMHFIEVPSEVIVGLYTDKIIENAIQTNALLVDLYDDDYEYWYCPKCKRITEISHATRKYTRSYFKKIENEVPELNELSQWQNITFYRDKETYDAVESDDSITVQEFLRIHPSRYIIRLSPDETRALVYTPKDHSYLFSYLLEPMPDWENQEERSKLEETKLPPNHNE